MSGLRSLADALESAGHTVLTKHLLAENVDAAESRLTEREVYDRDLAWLESCDLLIAEASGSSFGVGFEVGYVLGRSDRTHQRVILLYRLDRQAAISRLILGNGHRRCRVIGYSNPNSLANQIFAFATEH